MDLVWGNIASTASGLLAKSHRETQYEMIRAFLSFVLAFFELEGIFLHLLCIA
jgi:hypothetical protein